MYLCRHPVWTFLIPFRTPRRKCSLSLPYAICSSAGIPCLNPRKRQLIDAFTPSLHCFSSFDFLLLRESLLPGCALTEDGTQQVFLLPQNQQVMPTSASSFICLYFLLRGISVGGTVIDCAFSIQRVSRSQLWV